MIYVELQMKPQLNKKNFKIYVFDFSLCHPVQA